MKCNYLKQGYCNKYRKKFLCEPSTIKWFDKKPEDFIPIDQACKYSSLFGNDYIGLTQNDIERIQNGEVIHISGEYGIFIGYIDEEK